MKKIDYLVLIIGTCLAAGLLVAAVGDSATSIMQDSSANVLGGPFTFSNVVSQTTAASAPNHLVRYADFTNSANGKVLKAGDTMTGALIVSNNITATLTNGAAAYKVNSNAGVSFTITNLYNGVTNVIVYGSGIVTNNTQL